MTDEQSPGKGLAIAIVIVLILALAAFVFWYSSDKSEPAALVIPEPVTPAPAISAPRPEPEDPVIEQAREELATPEPEPIEPAPEPTPAVELPPLNESDAFVAEQLEPLSEPKLRNLVVPDEVVRKLVRAVIGVSENRLVNQYRPVMSPLPPLEVEQTSGGPEPEFTLTEKNYARYDKHIALMQSIEPAALAKVYRDMEPMFDEAYTEQGLDGGFRPILLQAIDKMLATPDIEDTIELVRPTVMYKFADPKLEKLSDPQKLLLRMGPEHRAEVKQYLEALKQALETLP